MAIIQIPNLPAVIGLDGSELFEGVQAGSSVKISLNQIIAATRGGTPATLPIPVSLGGTGLDTFTIGDIMYASATQTFSKLADVALGNAIISGGIGAAPSYGKIGLTTHVSGVLPVVNGGTGVTTSTGTGSVVLSNSPAFTGQASFADGTAAAPSIAHTGDLNAGLFFPAADTVAVATAGTERLRIDSSGNVGIGVAAPDRIGSVSSVNRILDIDGSITLPYAVTGAEPLRIGNFANTNFVPGSSSVGGAVGFTISNWNALSDGSGSTYLQAGVDTGNGGIQLQARKNNTGVVQRLADFTLGSLQFFTGDTERFRIASAGQLGIAGANYGTTGQTIVSAGSAAAPAWGTLPVAGGGTGAITLTGYVKGTGTAALTASATIPNTDVSGLGTMSTQAASAVAITGGTVNGTTVGATTASTGAFTTLSASSTVSGTGFSTYLASPPAIGGTVAAGGAFTSLTSTSGGINGTVGAATPNTGAFTTLSASSTVSGTGFSTYLASPPAIGGTVAAGGAFTTVTASTSVLSTGAGGIGYATGAGVAVTQLTSRTTTTPTTGAKTTGAVTLFTAAAVVNSYFSFTVPNTAIAITDTVVVTVRGATNTYVAFVTDIVAATSFKITMASVVGTASDTPIVNFTIIKGVSA
jgi:hypothetical protein